MQTPSRIDDPSWYPRAVEGAETNEVADGFIIYQSERDRVHYLNQTAAILLTLCNGRNRVSDIPELLRLAFDLSEAPVGETRDCLEQLITEGLIV